MRKRYNFTRLENGNPCFGSNNATIGSWMELEGQPQQILFRDTLPTISRPSRLVLQILFFLKRPILDFFKIWPHHGFNEISNFCKSKKNLQMN